MPPKELPTVVRGPRDILNRLPEDEKHFLRCFLSLLYEDTTVKLRRLFDTIDKNKDELISCTDFKHHRKEVAKYLKQMWEYFKKRFDFNDDDLITFDEFTQGSTCYFHTVYSTFQIKLILNLQVWSCKYISSDQSCLYPKASDVCI